MNSLCSFPFLQSRFSTEPFFGFISWAQRHLPSLSTGRILLPAPLPFLHELSDSRHPRREMTPVRTGITRHPLHCCSEILPAEKNKGAPEPVDNVPFHYPPGGCCHGSSRNPDQNMMTRSQDSGRISEPLGWEQLVTYCLRRRMRAGHPWRGSCWSRIFLVSPGHLIKVVHQAYAVASVIE